MTRAVANRPVVGVVQELELLRRARRGGGRGCGPVPPLRGRPRGAGRPRPFALARQLQRLDSLRANRVLDEPERLRADQDLARCGRLLEPGCHVDRVARRVALPSGSFAGDDLAGVDADARGERRPTLGLELLVQLGELGVDLARGAYGSHRVVLVDGRDAEDRHRGIADELLQGSAMPDDRPFGHGEEPVHDAPQRFRIELLSERRRSGDVGEEDRDDLADLATLRPLVAQRRAAHPAQPKTLRVQLSAVRARRHGASVRWSRRSSPGKSARTRGIARAPPTFDILDSTSARASRRCLRCQGSFRYP